VWWGTILKDTGGTGFWHEGYLRRGGFEAVYLDMFEPIGMGTLLRWCRCGARRSRRGRGPGLRAKAVADAPVGEKEYYSE